MGRAIRFLLEVALAGVLIAALWFGAPAVVGKRPPAGLLGVIGGMSLVLAFLDARKPNPLAKRIRDE